MDIPNGDQLLTWMRGYQTPCVLAAAADLGVFEELSESPRTSNETAERLACDARAMRILLDALASLGLLEKRDSRYSVPRDLVPLVVDASPQSVSAMMRHHASCLRRWTRLPWVVQSGTPADKEPSIRGAAADQAAFIEGMNVVCRDIAADLVREVSPGGFRCLLDVGGGPGTWTVAWLESEPGARAILFDLPHVIPMARERITEAGLADRVQFVEGDFYADRLPSGGDLAWVSAIIHQNSRDENRTLFRRIAEALDPRGTIYVRDIVMDVSRTTPVDGALFAVNMLVATPGGDAYTFAEIQEDLTAAGFADVQLVRTDKGMHSIVRARRPGP